MQKLAACGEPYAAAAATDACSRLVVVHFDFGQRFHKDYSDGSDCLEQMNLSPKVHSVLGNVMIAIE